MGFWSSAASFCSSVVSSVASSVSAACSAAKNMASKAIGWVAEKAEGFVGKIKETWQAVKPYVEQIRAGLITAAQVIPIPWVKAACLGLERGLAALTAFENSPIAKKIDEAIKWAIVLAKRWHTKPQSKEREENNVEEEILSDSELKEARRHQENLRFAEREIDPEHRNELELASAINDYEIAKADLAHALAGTPSNFEHYLRLRATQKLLGKTDKNFRQAKTIDELSADDLFLVRIASDLVKVNPELNDQAAIRLNRVLLEKFKKSLESFVYEEIVASWDMQAKKFGEQWDDLNRQHAKDSMLLKRLEIALEIQGELSNEEQLQLEQLKSEVPTSKQQLDAVATKQRDIKRYANAIEGFLQLLEKSEAEIEQEDRSYLFDDAHEIGKLLIDCAENDRAFASLEKEQQSLITDYANIFAKEAKTRMEEVLEVAA